MSGIATGTGLLIGGLAGAAGGITSGILGANAAGDAASTQANAANQAAQLQYQASQNALDFQKQQYNTTQQQLAPWLNTGTSALSNLAYLSGVGPTSAPTANPGGGPSAPGPNTSLGSYGSLLAPYSGSFTAPTALTEQNDPGYQARLNLGTQQLQQSAAARGNLLTGGTAQALDQFAQDYASNEYNNVYNRAYNTYATNYNQYQNQQNSQYNKLASLAGVGQQTASQLGTLGQNAANSESQNVLGTAQNIGQQLNNAGAANASGIVGASNAYGGAINSATGGLNNLLLLQSLFGNGSQAGSTAGYTNELGAYIP